MKKTFVFALCCALAAFSCTQKVDISIEAPQDEPAAGKVVTISATLSDELTKVAFDPTYDGGKPTSLALAWAAGDQIRIYNNADRSKYEDFTLAEGSVGQQKGCFSGETTKLAGATAYDVEVIGGEGFDYASQTQPADGVTTDLKYLASVTNIADYSTIEFTSFNSVLAITAKMPSIAAAAAVKSVDITASADIFAGGNTLTITLETPGSEDDILNFYATLPQGDQAIAAGTTLIVKFNAPGTDHTVYTRYIELPASTFTNKKLNTININASNSASYANASTASIGTESNPYLIGDEYQMAAIDAELSTTEKKFFKLIDDITLSSWTSINCDTKGAIDLNGNGKTISGLNKPLFEFFDGKVSNLVISGANITATGSNYYGVLARTVDGANSCELTNVSVINSSVTAKGTIGGLVGKIGSTSPCALTNCTVDVNLTGSGYYIGGLVGQVTNGTLTHCSATGDVSSSTHFASAFVGYVDGTVGIEECFATGDIKTTAASIANLGGIVASTAATGKLTIENCYYSGIIGTDDYNTRRWCGGILGTTNAGAEIDVTNCYASFSVKSANPTLDGALVGNNQSTVVTCSGFVGWSTISKMAGANNAVSAEGNYLGKEGSIYSQAVTLGGWDFTKVWTTDDTPQLRPYVAE